MTPNSGEVSSMEDLRTYFDEEETIAAGELDRSEWNAIAEEEVSFDIPRD